VELRVVVEENANKPRKEAIYLAGIKIASRRAKNRLQDDG
jgi:hypothetical protein